MTLGDTIALRPRVPGIWSVQGPGEILLSERAAVQVVGGGLPAVPDSRALATPRELTLLLRPRGRGESLSALRRDLLPFCRPETPSFQLIYTGAQRSLELSCAYRSGLDELALQLVATNPLWGSASVAGAAPAVITLGCSATVAPTLVLGGSGAVTRIRNTFAFTNTVLDLLFSLTVQPGETITIDPTRCTIVSTARGSLLETLLPGSRLASFRLFPGAPNDLALTAGPGVTLTYRYNLGWWSWEEADG